MISIMSDTYVEGTTLKNERMGVISVCVSGGRLFSCDYGNAIKVWDVATGACVQTLEGHADHMRSVCVSPNGSRLFSGNADMFSGNADNTIKVWDVATGACVQTLQGHADEVESVCVSGDRLFSGSADKTIKVWDWRAGVCLRTMEGHGSLVYSVCVSPDGSRLFSGSEDNTIKVWNMTGTCLQTLQGHTSAVLTLCASGDRLFSGSDDKTIKVWELPDTYVEDMKISSENTVVSLCVSGNRLFSGTDDNKIEEWDLETGNHVQTLEGYTDSMDVFVNSLYVSGNWLFTGKDDSVIEVYDLRSDEGTPQYTLEGHEDTVNSVCVIGDFLFSGSQDETIKVWNWKTGACVQTLEGHTDYVFSVCLSGDGSRLFSGSQDETIKVWDVSTGACVQTLQGHTDNVRSVCVSGDGSRLFSGSEDNTIKVWHIEDEACQLEKTLEGPKGHTDPVVSVCVSGDRLFSGSDDKTIKVWDWGAGTCLQTLPRAFLTSLCVSGSRLFSGDMYGTIKVFKVWVPDNDIEITGSVSIQDGINQVFADADIVDVDALDLLDPGHSGGESKTSDYIKMGYVSPYKEELNVSVPDFSGFNCYHERLDPRLRCKIAKEVQKCREDVQKVERLRFAQRRAAGWKRSVYLFLCVKNKDNDLQPDLNVYVYCAFALQSLGWKHRMVIYDERASHESLLETAARLEYQLSAAFVKQNVICMPYVNNYDKLKTAVKDIEDNEEIALVYLSAHGDKRGILYGPWEGGKDIALTQRGLISFGKELHKNMSPDCQVFLNSCYAGKSTAIVLSLQLDGHFVLAASDSIPSGKVVHRFQIDAGNDRLYFSAQCPRSEIKAYSTDFVDGSAAAASVHPQRRLERQSSGNPRPNQRRRRDEYRPKSPDYPPYSPPPPESEETASDWWERHGYQESQRSPSPSPRGYTNVSFRF